MMHADALSQQAAALAIDSGLFDSAFYIDRCSDSLPGSAIPVVHYLRWGRFNGVEPNPLFDSPYYRSQCASLADDADPLIHYIEAGSNSRINPHPLFDAQYYCSQLDVSASGLTPLGHYLTFGTRGANPNEYFDNQFYVQQVPEILELGINPLAHYLLTGARQGLDPGPRFHTRYYLERNPDIAGGDMNPLLHFLHFGRYEKRLHFAHFRSPEPPFSLSDYERMRGLEPSIPAASALGSLEEVRTPLQANAGRAYFGLCELLTEPFSHLILTPSIISEQVVTSIQAANAPLVLVTDGCGITNTESLPAGLRCVALNNLASELTEQEKILLLVRLILQARPTAITNADSITADKLYDNFGRQIAAASALQSQTRPVHQDVPGSKPQFDISVVINAHREGQLLDATVKSALDAIALARAESLSVQLLIILDSPDAATRAYCTQFKPPNAQLIEVDFKDIGLARNAAIEAATGKYIAFLDGDDLFGRNWLVEAYRFITADTREILLHPSWNIHFQGHSIVWRLLDQEDPEFSKHILLEHNPWTALSFGCRSTYRKVPFRPTTMEKGFGFEDWLFNCDTVARGIVHKVVPRTFHCVRKRTEQHSLSDETLAANCIIADSDLFALPLRGCAR